MPVFEVGNGFEELGGQAEADGGDVTDADESPEDHQEGLEFADIAGRLAIYSGSGLDLWRGCAGDGRVF